MGRRGRVRVVAAAVGLPLVLASCATGGDAGSEPGTLRIATVDNRDLLRLEELSATFTADNPEITLEWV
ncbi:MAG: hypothetical protein WA962_06205, partial [Ornithinimicrobium sp.]